MLFVLDIVPSVVKIPYLVLFPGASLRAKKKLPAIGEVILNFG